jgi:hypothetical protein
MNLGSELVTNGVFAADTNWTKTAGGGWSIQVGHAEISTNDTDPDEIYQSISITAGNTYRVTFSSSYYQTHSGTIFKVLLGGTTVYTFPTGASNSDPLDFEYDVIAGSSDTRIKVQASETGLSDTLYIDNVSVKEVLVCVLERIAEQVRLTVAAVTEANGFSQTLTALRPKRVHFWDELTADNTVLITQEQPERLEMTHTTIDWRQPFVLQAICMDSDAATASIETRLNAARADLEQKLMTDITLGGLAYDLQIEPPDYFAGEHFTGVAVNISVFYRTLLTDPYTSA